MRGYWQDDVATSEVLQEGWLRTGDLGEFDHKGNLKITGRKKEMIVLSTGKNISPGEIEKVLVGSPLIENVCVVGDGQKCLGAIIVPNREALRGEIRRRKLWVWSKRRAVTHPAVRNAYRKELDRLLESVNAESSVGPFVILTRNFSSELGELTPKLSLRRQAISANFASQIAKMFRELSQVR